MTTPTSPATPSTSKRGLLRALLGFGVTATGNRANGASGSGGAILNDGRLEVLESVLENNQSSRAGGAIENLGTKVIPHFRK